VQIENPSSKKKEKHRTVGGEINNKYIRLMMQDGGRGEN
jgi:hypothetical protein